VTGSIIYTLVSRQTHFHCAFYSHRTPNRPHGPPTAAAHQDLDHVAPIGASPSFHAAQSPLRQNRSDTTTTSSKVLALLWPGSPPSSTPTSIQYRDHLDSIVASRNASAQIALTGPKKASALWGLMPGLLPLSSEVPDITANHTSAHNLLVHSLF
jgi:hypothetical protein